MTLQIDFGLENDKLLFPTLVFRATEMRSIEMFFQFIVIEEIFIPTTGTNANEALLMSISAMLEQRIGVEEEHTTEIAGWMTREPVVDCLCWRWGVLSSIRSVQS